ncbi:MAG: MFS transporter [Peptococcaceae bacterium BICA1-7]|nr:MAG: MFS transporter [Peptococcaceae bacterium BICA1-7]HBV97547.1 MFS transporter [Desulfotomaculum sp.]
MNGLKSITRSFGYRNYRLYFFGQAVSMTGTFMQSVTISWLVYGLTNSVFYLGVVEFVGQIPFFLVVPFAGVLIDRWNRHRTFIATNALSMVQAFIMAILVLTDKISIWYIIPLSLFLGLVGSFDLPVRQSFVFNIVEKREDLGNAVALSNSMFNLARLIGPSIAGLLILAVGEGICLVINGISYLVIIAALLAMKVKPQKIENKNTNILKGLKEGYVYAFNSSPIKSIIILQGFVSLTAWPTAVLMPVFVKEILHGGPQTLGFLMAFSGMGALAGTLYLASRKDARGLVKLIPLAVGIHGVALLAFSQSRSPGLCMFWLMFAGFGVFVQMAASGTVLQSIVEDDKRGRVMSFFTVAFRGLFPFGSLMAAALAGIIGVPHTILICGFFCIAGSLIFISKSHLISEAVNQQFHKIEVSASMGGK